jgi:hypothetical protein
MTSRVRPTSTGNKSQVGKCEVIKLESLYIAKDTINRVKRQLIG